MVACCFLGLLRELAVKGFCSGNGGVLLFGGVERASCKGFCDRGGCVFCRGDVLFVDRSVDWCAKGSQEMGFDVPFVLRLVMGIPQGEKVYDNILLIGVVSHQWCTVLLLQVREIMSFIASRRIATGRHRATLLFIILSNVHVLGGWC